MGLPTPELFLLVCEAGQGEAGESPPRPVEKTPSQGPDNKVKQVGREEGAPLAGPCIPPSL